MVRLPAAAVDAADLAGGTCSFVTSPPPGGQEAEATAEAEVEHIVDPVSGECAAIDDADELIGLYAALDSADKKIYAAKLKIRQALSQLTEGDRKTRRVAGQTRTAKLTYPDVDWDQSILREIYESYPQHRDTYLRISSLRPLKREVAKLQGTSGPPDLNTVRDMFTTAARESHRPPTVTVEK